MSITDERENFKMQPIYQAIVAHQRGADGWANHEKLLWLREWGHRFIKELGLKNKDGEYLGMPLVKVEPLNIKTVCCYRQTPDGYALTGTIVANEKRLGDEPDFETLTHLLRALLDAWRHQHCPDQVFEQECLERLKGLGIRISKRLTTIEKGRRFEQLLRKRGVKIPEDQTRTPKLPQGRSTNMLWSCFCQKVRVGRGSFEAWCPRCKSYFQPGDGVKFHSSKSKMTSTEDGARDEALPAA